MGIDYTAGMFFGTFAKRGTEAHRKLCERWDANNSDDIDLEGVENVSVKQHGNSWSGDFCFALQHGGGTSFSSRGAGYEGPFTPEAGQADAIRAAIRVLELREEDFEPIGFFVYQDVW